MNQSESRRPMRRAWLAALVLACAGPVFATTWVVDAANGPGANFTTINAALAVAVPGDIILVKAGAYTEDLVISIGVSIVGWNATTYPMTVPANPFLDVIWGTALVQNIPAGQKVVLSGLNFARTTATGGFTIGVNNCVGPVVLDRVITPNGGIFVGDSTDVFMQDVRVRHQPGADPPTPGLLVSNSYLQGTDLNLAASDLGGEPNFYFNAPHALDVQNNSVVSICRPKLIGAIGGGPWITSPSTPGGGSAIHCSSSIVSVVSNGSGLFYLIGGQGGSRGVGSAPNIPSGFGGPAILCENGGTVLTKSAPTPLPGAPGPNLAGGPLGLAPPGVVTLTNGSLQVDPLTPATMRLVGTTTPGGSAYISYLAAAPFYPLVIAFATGFSLQPLPPAVQFLGVDLPSVFFYLSGTANAGRFFAIGFNMPTSFAGIEGSSLVLQGADFVASIYYLTNCSILTLPY
jgi:hypothetical protein